MPLMFSPTLVAVAWVMVSAANLAAEGTPLSAPTSEWWSDFRLWQVVSPFAGALVGFFGATFVNDWLHRRRDERLREEKAKTLTGEMCAELVSASIELAHLAKVFRRTIGREKSVFRKTVASLSEPKFDIYRENRQELGLLGPKNALAIATLVKLVAQGCGQIFKLDDPNDRVIKEVPSTFDHYAEKAEDIARELAMPVNIDVEDLIKEAKVANPDL